MIIILVRKYAQAMVMLLQQHEQTYASDIWLKWERSQNVFFVKCIAKLSKMATNPHNTICFDKVSEDT